MAAPLPKIQVCPDGLVRAGAYVLEPSSPHFRRRRVFWRCRLDGKPVSGWTFSPALALSAALRKSSPRL